MELLSITLAPPSAILLFIRDCLVSKNSLDPGCNKKGLETSKTFPFLSILSADCLAKICASSLFNLNPRTPVKKPVK